MCGLVAMVSKLQNGFTGVNLDAFDILLFVDQLRGMDSTGVFCVNNHGNVSVAKQASHSTDFIQEPGYKAVRQEAIHQGWAMVGHNRKATRGKVNDENAHPFWVDDKLVLVHNGTMWGDHKQHADVEVDSHAIAHILAENEDIEKAMQKINAAYALIWYDVTKKQLNFFRNTQRPLYWCETRDAYYMASEADFLTFALGRTNQAIINDGELPFSFDVHSLDSWILQDDKTTKLATRNLDAMYKTPVANAPSAVPFTQHPLMALPSPRDSRSHACAFWPGDDDDAEYVYRPTQQDGVDQPTPTELENLRRVAEELSAEETKKAVDEAIASAKRAQEAKKDIQVETIGIPKWTNVHSFTDWTHARLKYTDQRVKVECKDYLSEDAGPNRVYMTGKTADEDGIFCIFPIHKALFEAITSPSSKERMDNKAVFSVEVDRVLWRKTEGPSKASDYDAKAKGLITLRGKSARIYQVQGKGMH